MLREVTPPKNDKGHCADGCHNMPKRWIAKEVDGRMKVYCKFCGKWIGYKR